MSAAGTPAAVGAPPAGSAASACPCHWSQTTAVSCLATQKSAIATPGARRLPTGNREGCLRGTDHSFHGSGSRSRQTNENALLTCRYIEPVSGFEPLTCRLQGTGTFAGQRPCDRSACSLRAASVLDRDGLGQPCGVAMLSQFGQRGRDLSVAAIHRVKVAVRRDRRRMAHPPDEILRGRARRGGQGLASVPQVVEPKARMPTLRRARVNACRMASPRSRDDSS
jgi:hypothetical protein